MSFTFRRNSRPVNALSFLYEFSLPCLDCLQCCIFGEEDDPELAYSPGHLEKNTGIPRQYLPDIFPPSGPDKLILKRSCRHLTEKKLCGIYLSRPYLCALYPFQVHSRKKNRYSIGVSDLCPYSKNIDALYKQEYSPLLNFINLLVQELTTLNRYDMIFNFIPYRFRLLTEVAADNNDKNGE